MGGTPKLWSLELTPFNPPPKALAGSTAGPTNPPKKSPADATPAVDKNVRRSGAAACSAVSAGTAAFCDGTGAKANDCPTRQSATQATDR